MTPAEFIETIRRMHEPYLPHLVNVRHIDPCHPEYNSGQWHEPSVDEQAESLDLWCDGCNWLASKCRVAFLLAMVEMSEEE